MSVKCGFINVVDWLNYDAWLSYLIRYHGMDV